MRIPRRKGPGPRPAPWSETYATGVDVFHNERSAAAYLGVGVTTLRKRSLACERFPGGFVYYKQSMLDAHLVQLAERRAKKLAEGRANRQAAARRTHTTQPTWTDEHGITRALDQHPNEPVCRELHRRTPPELMCPAWKDRAALTYGVTEVIGIRPGRDRLETIIPGDVYGPDTVLWWPRERRLRREPDVVDLAERAAEAKRPRMQLLPEGRRNFDRLSAVQCSRKNRSFPRP